MATILAKLLQKDILPSDIMKWLRNDCNIVELPEDLKELDNLKSEFVPFFINYLRDQSFNLLQTGHSSNTTPAKTPLSAKFKKQFSKTRAENKSKSDFKARNRMQLFDNCGDNTNRTAPKKNHGSRFAHSGSESAPRSQRSIHFNTPDSSHRSKTRHSFGDFITPEVDWKKKSPHSLKREDGFTPLQQHSGKRSTGKKSAEKHGGASVLHAAQAPPNFTLEAEDFPSLAGGSVTSTPKPANVSSIPEGARMITQSRRITPTLLKSSKQPKKSSLKDISLNKRQDSPGAGSKASLFASPSAGSGWNTSNVFSGQALSFEKTPNANSSLEDERQLLRAIKSGNVDSPSDSLLSTSESTTPVMLSSKITTAMTSSPNICSPVNVRPAGIIPISQNKIRSVSSLLQSPVRTSLAQSPVKALAVLDSSDIIGGTTPTKASVLLAVATGLSKTPIKGSCTVPVSEFPTVTPTKPVGLDRLQSVTEFTTAYPSQVTYAQELDILAQLYIAFIDENLVPNLTVELYFLFQLLTVRGGELEQSTEIAQDPDEIEYLHCVHNAVYFAVTVLSKQTRVLKLLDKGTLRLLLDNQRLVEFDKGLSDTLLKLHDTSPARPFPMGITSPIGGVSFQAETDNRNNFPTDRSFHLFCKQRDMFYELLRVWQENHMTAGWSLVETQGVRIHSLVAERSELANFVHFARLFQSQLIHMCKADRSHLVEGEDNNVSLLVQLKKSNPEKFKKLQERFITPASTRGPCPQPTFPGCQEFFKDFVLAARCPQFYQHLSDTLTAKICELNSMEFHLTENLEDTSDVEERERLSDCLITLRLLSKFLGLLHFLSYQSTEHLSARITDTCIAIRDKVSATIDLLPYLKSAQKEGRLVLTIPWVIEYLSMMDVVAPQLQYFQQVLMYLLKIHRHICVYFGSIWSHSLLLVISYLGWLFELAVFPEGLFFRDLTDSDDIKAPPDGALDVLGLVDQQILYTCCPYLSELRILLVEFAVGTSSRNNQNSIRKITPISTETSSTTTALSEKQLQHQLEENFFHNHPASLKRTVEFVADRVASNHIKKFRATVLPNVLEQIYKEAGDLATEISTASPDTKHQKKSEHVILQRSLQLCSKLRKSDQQDSVGYCKDKVMEILPQLLPEEISKGVLQVCGKMSQRLALEKVQIWMNMHITTAMLKREMTNEYEKRMKSLIRSKSSEDNLGTPQGKSPSKPFITKSENASLVKDSCEVVQSVHDIKVLSPSDILIELKNVICEMVVENNVEESIPLLIEIMAKVPAVFKFRQDLTSGVSKSIGRVLCDVTCFLVTIEPDLWQKVKSNMLSLLDTVFKQDLFDGILSPIVLHYLLNSRDKKLSWSAYSDLLKLLLSKKYVTPEKLCTTAMTCIQQGLEPQILHELVTVLCEVIKAFHLGRSCSSEDFFVLIDAMLVAVNESEERMTLVKDTMICIHNHHAALEITDKTTVPQEWQTPTENLKSENKTGPHLKLDDDYQKLHESFNGVPVVKSIDNVETVCISSIIETPKEEQSVSCTSEKVLIETKCNKSTIAKDNCTVKINRVGENTVIMDCRSVSIDKTLINSQIVESDMLIESKQSNCKINEC